MEPACSGDIILHILHRLSYLLALAVPLVAIGCGGGDDDAPEQISAVMESPTSAAEEVPTVEGERAVTVVELYLLDRYFSHVDLPPPYDLADIPVERWLEAVLAEVFLIDNLACQAGDPADEERDTVGPYTPVTCTLQAAISQGAPLNTTGAEFRVHYYYFGSVTEWPLEVVVPSGGASHFAFDFALQQISESMVCSKLFRRSSSSELNTNAGDIALSGSVLNVEIPAHAGIPRETVGSAGYESYQEVFSAWVNALC